MATVEYRKEARAERKIAVKTVEILVCNGSLLCPIEIVRDETFTDMIDLLKSVIPGNLRPVPAVKQYALHIVFGTIKQPGQAFANRIGCRAFVEDNANVFRFKTALLQNLGHA